jgi:DNA repair protein RecN (Recombination protein N)
MAESTHLPTLIFDEIDTGISGETAKQVGIIMKNLGLQHQVIAVTHLPQIAAVAQTHLYVYKKMNNQQQLITSVKVLEGDERINELATMLSGNKPSQQAVDTAKELVMNN